MVAKVRDQIVVPFVIVRLPIGNGSRTKSRQTTLVAGCDSLCSTVNFTSTEKRTHAP